MTAEDKMSRAFLIVAAIGVVGGLSAIALTVWIFWSIASYL